MLRTFYSPTQLSFVPPDTHQQKKGCQRNIRLYLRCTYPNRFDTVPAVYNVLVVTNSVTTKIVRYSTCDVKRMMYLPFKNVSSKKHQCPPGHQHITSSKGDITIQMLVGLRPPNTDYGLIKKQKMIVQLECRSKFRRYESNKQRD